MKSVRHSIQQPLEMNLAEAEGKLDDYLMKGIVSEIFWADEAKALAVKIGDHAATLNPTQYGHLR